MISTAIRDERPQPLRVFRTAHGDELRAIALDLLREQLDVPPAASPTTRSSSGNASTTASVLLPIDPVLPRMEMDFIAVKL